MLTVPNIQKFTDARTFLEIFYSENRLTISHRSFAEEIGWPASYLSDVIQGRRGLSVARAIEFARHFAMTGIETERLVMLALKDIESGSVKEFVEGYLSKEGRTWQEPTANCPRSEADAPYIPPDQMVDRVLSSLRMALVWRNGRITAQEIGELLYLCPELKDPEVLAERLSFLRGQGLISGELPEITVHEPDLGTSGMTKQIFFDSLLNLQGAVAEKQRTGHWQMASLVFPRKHYSELIQRVRALVNWTHNLCKNNPEAPVPAPEDHVVIQTHFMVTHLLNLEKLGLKIVNDSEDRHVITSSAPT